MRFVQAHQFWTIAFVLPFFFHAVQAQETSDSLIKRQMEGYGVQFTRNNSITLLMSGQEKFDDMFKAIRQARHSVHL